MTCDVAIIKKAFPAAPSHWIWKIFFPKDICAQENTGGIVAGTTVAFCNRLHPETFFSPLTSKKLHIESLESIFYWFVALLCCFNFRIMHLFLLGLQISAPGNMIIQSVIPFSNPTGLNKTTLNSLTKSVGNIHGVISLPECCHHLWSGIRRKRSCICGSTHVGIWQGCSLINSTYSRTLYFGTDWLSLGPCRGQTDDLINKR